LLYIKLEENDNEIIGFFKIIDKIKSIIFNLKIDRIENAESDKVKTLITIKDVSDITIKKISKYIKQNCIKIVCLSDNLQTNNTFTNILKSEGIKIFDGRWLFEHLTKNIVEYVSNCKKEKIEVQEVSVLTHKIDRIIVSSIKEIALNVRAINIITDKENVFRKLENELYSEYGIILNMNNNYKKSLVKSDIIINFDYTEEDLKKYNLPKKACIINLQGDTKLDSKIFEGISSSFFEIIMPDKYIRNLVYLKGFNNQVLYESFIYKNTIPENIKKEIKDDKVCIISLVGKNGRIRKNEFLNLSKKVVN